MAVPSAPRRPERPPSRPGAARTSDPARPRPAPPPPRPPARTAGAAPPRLTTPAPPPAGPAPRARDAAPGADYVRFCSGIHKVTGIDLSQYRPAQMERRLRTFAGRHGAGDLDELLVLVRKDAGVRDKFLDHMTINVSELFRNPERFDELERTFLPGLVRSGPGTLKVWSAGCSYGAEPYSLAMLALEAAPGRRHEVHATDIDQTILARARRARFTDADVKNVSRARLAKWMTSEPGEDGTIWTVADQARSLVRFRQHNLLTDRYPDGLDLIACRNVVIYFNEDAKDQIYRRFLAALRPGGILFVGSTERVNGADAMGWERAGSFFYRKPA